MIRRPPRSTQGVSSAASDVYKRQVVSTQSTWDLRIIQNMEAKIAENFQTIYEYPELKIKIEVLMLKYRAKIVFFISELNRIGTIVRADMENDAEQEALEEEAKGSDEATVTTKILLGDRSNESVHLLANAFQRLVSQHFQTQKGLPIDFYSVLCFVSLKKRGSESIKLAQHIITCIKACLLYTSPSPRDLSTSRMPSSA
eukprot:TRINITY_DN21804_c0_g1_i2.p1 TRINITY_DN21804_c0_g1~~TRINITY_DN21804_c0_g1_i2.p1  ORF type:complete len:200 (-),score=52.45 TRINITY_DN21804_c0_g1_i2:105-704(-)